MMQGMVEITLAKKSIGGGRCLNALNWYEIRTEGQEKRDIQVNAEA